MEFESILLSKPTFVIFFMASSNSSVTLSTFSDENLRFARRMVTCSRVSACSCLYFRSFSSVASRSSLSLSSASSRSPFRRETSILKSARWL